MEHLRRAAACVPLGSQPRRCSDVPFSSPRCCSCWCSVPLALGGVRPVLLVGARFPPRSVLPCLLLAACPVGRCPLLARPAALLPGRVLFRRLIPAFRSIWLWAGWLALPGPRLARVLSLAPGPPSEVRRAVDPRAGTRIAGRSSIVGRSRGGQDEGSIKRSIPQARRRSALLVCILFHATGSSSGFSGFPVVSS